VDGSIRGSFDSFSSNQTTQDTSSYEVKADTNHYSFNLHLLWSHRIGDKLEVYLGGGPRVDIYGIKGKVISTHQRGSGSYFQEDDQGDGLAWGLEAILGFDYYVTSRISIGFESELLYMRTKYSFIREISSEEGGTPTEHHESNSDSWSLGTVVGYLLLSYHF